MNCPACQGVYVKALNDKGVCDTCFVLETRQRLLYALSGEQDADLTVFANWLIEHTKEEYEQWG